jgi:hypothetical protein
VIIPLTTTTTTISGFTTSCMAKIEVLVKAEHDFYREKLQKEKEQN